MKEVNDNQDNFSPAPRPRKHPHTVRSLFLKCLLAIVVVVALPLILEGVLKLGGYGDSPSFFVDSPIQHVDAWVDNPAFTRPFFSRSMERTPAPLYLPHEKPEDEVRILVLGASAAMGDPMPEFGLPRMLQALMDQSVTGKSIRVINAAITAINSHVVRVLAPQCLKIKPDAVVVYLGNNEIVGPFGPGTVFSGFYKSRLWIKAATIARRSRTGQLLTAVRDAVAEKGKARREWGGMEMFLAGKFSFDHPDVDVARKHFAGNLREIIQTFTEENIPVVLSTVAVNLDDFPPLLSPDEDELYKKAIEVEANSDRHAALQLYGRACDSDQLRFRADSAINRIIREEAERFGGDKVVRVDAAEYFRGLYLEGAPGSDLYVDHVHFTFNGNYRLAQLIAAALPDKAGANKKQLNAVSEAMCKERLAYSAWAEQAVWTKMKNRYLRPLFSRQHGHLERLTRIMNEERLAQALMNEQNLNRWISLIDDNLAAHPDDIDLLLWRGRFYLRQEKPNEALQDFLMAAQYCPQSLTAHGHALFLQTMSEGHAAAIENLHRVWRGEKRRLASVIHYTAKLLLDNGELESAVAWFREGVNVDRTFPGMITKLGYVTLLTGKPELAVPFFKDALTVDPGDRKAMSFLGVAYGELKQWPEALRRLEAAVELAPDDPEVQYNFAVGLMKNGQADDAAKVFARVMELNPVDLDAAAQFMDILWKKADLESAARVCSQSQLFYPNHTPLIQRADLIKARSGHAISAERSTDAAVSVWLAATGQGTESKNSSALNAYLARHYSRSSDKSSPLSLITTAALLRQNRFSEASQQLQAARLFIMEPGDELKQLMTQLSRAIKEEEAFVINPEARGDDPMLSLLWSRL